MAQALADAKADTPVKAPPLVFISYSHKDEQWKDRLRPHLVVLERQGRITIWDDRQIDAGVEWQPAIMDVMTRCRVAICLISSDYLASEFCTGQELPELLKKREQGEITIIPVLLRPCDWQDYPWLEELQMLPRDGKSVTEDYAGHWDHVFTKVAHRVRKAVGSSSAIHRISDQLKEKKTKLGVVVFTVLAILVVGIYPLVIPSKQEIPENPEILSLLETARMHELVGRTCAPAGSNAYELYRLVLEMSPANQAAIEALDQLNCQ